MRIDDSNKFIQNLNVSVVNKSSNKIRIFLLPIILLFVVRTSSRISYQNFIDPLRILTLFHTNHLKYSK